MNRATSGSRPVRGLRRASKCGFARNRTSKQRSSAAGRPCLKPKETSDTARTPGSPGLAEVLRDGGAQLVDRHRPSCRSRGPPSPSPRRGGAARTRRPRRAERPSASGCGRRVSEKRFRSACSSQSRKRTVIGSRVAERLEELRESARRNPGCARPGRRRSAGAACGPPATSPANSSRSESGQVVDGRVADVLERVRDVGLFPIPRAPWRRRGAFRVSVTAPSRAR